MDQLNKLSPNVTVRRSPRIHGNSRNTSAMQLDVSQPNNSAMKRGADNNSPRTKKAQPTPKRSNSSQIDGGTPTTTNSTTMAHSVFTASPMTQLLPPAAFMSVSSVAQSSTNQFAQSTSRAVNSPMLKMDDIDLPFTDDKPHNTAVKNPKKRRSSLAVGRKSLCSSQKSNKSVVQEEDDKTVIMAGEQMEQREEVSEETRLRIEILKHYCRSLNKELQDYDSEFQKQRELKRIAVTNRTKREPKPCEMELPQFPVLAEKPPVSIETLSKLIAMKRKRAQEKVEMEIALMDAQTEKKMKILKKSLGIGPPENPRALIARLFLS